MTSYVTSTCIWHLRVYDIYVYMTSEITSKVRTLPIPMLLAHTCTQVHWLSPPNPVSDWILHETNYLRVYDSPDRSRKITPSPSICYSFSLTNRSIGYHNQTQPLSECAARLMYLRGLYNSTSKWITTSLTELMYGLSMYDDPPSVWGVWTSSSFSSLSFITPTPSHFLFLDLVFSVIINNNTGKLSNDKCVDNRTPLSKVNVSRCGKIISIPRPTILKKWERRHGRRDFSDRIPNLVL
jgi:hypothetical protein